MGKRHQNTAGRPASPSSSSPARSFDAITLVTLVGLVVAFLVSFASWQKMGFIEKSLDDRLARIEARVAAVVDDAAGAQAQPAGR